MSFGPAQRAPEIGLLLLRLAAGLSLFFLFGLRKVGDASHFFLTGKWLFVNFNRAVGLPAPVLVAVLQTLNETIGALLVAAGLWTRPAATFLSASFVIAALCSLKMRESAWLIAAAYAVVFAVIALCGPGRLSFDGGRSRPSA